MQDLLAIHLVSMSALDKDFHEIDYVKGLPERLHRENVMDKGAITTVNFYREAQSNAWGGIDYSGLVVREDHAYTRDAFGLASSRVVMIQWAFADGKTFHPRTKTRRKLYNAQEALRESEVRRRNIINGLKPHLLLLLQVAAGFDTLSSFVQAQAFFDTYQGNVASYLESGSSTLRDAISLDEIFPWLNLSLWDSPTTIREVLIQELS